MTNSPWPYYGAWVIQCSTFREVIKPLFRGAHSLGPQYLADSVREANRTHLGYWSKLSRLRALEPLSTSRSMERHPVA
jgi:hypothetical protein